MTAPEWTVAELDEWNPLRTFGYKFAARGPNGGEVYYATKRQANARAKEENAKTPALSEAK